VSAVGASKEVCASAIASVISEHVKVLLMENKKGRLPLHNCPVQKGALIHTVFNKLEDYRFEKI